MYTLKLFVLVIFLTSQSLSQVFYHWQFDENHDIEMKYGKRWGKFYANETVTNSEFKIKGLAKYVPGVKGSAIKFDGFSSYVEGVPSTFEDDNDDGPFPREISIEAWIALGAYPWNWAPIITVGKYKVTGFYFGVDSRGRLGFHMSDATSVWHEANSKLNHQTKLGMELHKWHHVVGTYSPRNGLAVYINGELEGTYKNFQFDYGIAYSNLDRGIRMGKNPIDLAPTEPIRDWATYPSRYTFDGIVDEVKIHNGELSAEKIANIYSSTIPENEPLFHPRKFPSIKPSGRFSANYTRLTYYQEWDALWPVGEFMDVVVQFDELPTKVMFWRGTRYSACQVSENGKWMADQSRETGNN